MNMVKCLNLLVEELIILQLKIVSNDRWRVGPWPCVQLRCRNSCPGHPPIRREFVSVTRRLIGLKSKQVANICDVIAVAARDTQALGCVRMVNKQ